MLTLFGLLLTMLDNASAASQAMTIVLAWSRESVIQRQREEIERLRMAAEDHDASGWEQAEKIRRHAVVKATAAVVSHTAEFVGDLLDAHDAGMVTSSRSVLKKICRLMLPD